jgi:hypothetical protein
MGNIYDKINVDNIYEIDTTIISFHFDVNHNHFKIDCNPSFDTMILRKDHPNFINLYNKLKPGMTYNFKCSNWIFNLDNIIDITECQIFTVCDKVIGFVNIQNELNSLKHYDEIILETTIKKRLLINEIIRQNFIIGKKYKINCIKKFGDNFYSVLNFELVDLEN